MTLATDTDIVPVDTDSGVVEGFPADYTLNLFYLLSCDYRGSEDQICIVLFRFTHLRFPSAVVSTETTSGSAIVTSQKH